MSTASTDNGSRAKRNVMVLVMAQALLGAQMPLVFTIGGLAGEFLSPNPCLATLPITLIVLASMLSANPISGLMQNFGRRTGFLIGTCGGGIGGIICAIAMIQQSFSLLLLGSFCTGLYMSAQGFYRFAATDMASDAFRPKAISYVMAGGLLAAIFGTQAFKLTTDWFLTPFLGAYIIVVAINFFGSFLFLGLDIPKPEPAKSAADRGRNVRELLKDPVISVAIICGMVSYGLMNLVMTSTPLAVVGCGFTKGNAADVVMSHVLAMFIPSFFTGHLIARFGSRRIISIGLILLLVAGMIGFSDTSLPTFFAALICLGVGWNFGFIGATSLLAGAHSVGERGRVQGLNDMCVFGFVTLASLSSGGLMNCIGGSAEAGWQTVNLAVVPPVALAFLALFWLHRREQSVD